MTSSHRSSSQRKLGSQATFAELAALDSSVRWNDGGI